MNYIWIQDNGWRGCIIVVAPNEETARVAMRKSMYNYEENKEILKFDINTDFFYENFGDS